VIDLRLGDCLELMRDIPDGSVDAVITDPPYGVGFDYGTEYVDSERKYKNVIDNLLHSESLVKPGGFMVVYQPAKHARYWAEWFPREWKPIALLRNFVAGWRGDIVPATDYALWWKVGKGTKARDWQDFFARDWFLCNTAPANRDPLSRGHPCPRPLDGVSYLVKCFCPPNGIVVDLFMGSGTTGVACVKLNRNFIGMEIDPTYFEIAQRRIAEAQAQGALL